MEAVPGRGERAALPAVYARAVVWIAREGPPRPRLPELALVAVLATVLPLV
jgi:hypothetical protein